MNPDTPEIVVSQPASLAVDFSPVPVQSVVQPNTSGLGKDSVIPEEIKGWSWGGFLWTWIWAIGNKTWVGLLGLIYPINLIIAIILGIKGREWAWRNKKWESIEAFNKTQRNWVKWWLIIISSLTTLAIIGIIFTAVLVAVDPMKQTRVAKCVQSCQTANDPQVCIGSCK